MAIEDRSDYPQWLNAQNNLIEVRAAFERGDATQADVDKAQTDFDRISAELN